MTAGDALFTSDRYAVRLDKDHRYLTFKGAYGDFICALEADVRARNKINSRL